MNAKTSVFVIFVEAIIYLLLYNLHDCTFKGQHKKFSMKMSFKFLLYQVLNKKFVQPSSSEILPAAHTYLSVELIPPRMIIESTSMVDSFNDDASFYVLPSYGCLCD